MKGLRTTKKLMVSIILLINILIIGCTSQRALQEPPQIAITIEDKKIGYVVAKNKWDGSIYHREDIDQIKKLNKIRSNTYIQVEEAKKENPYSHLNKIKALNKAQTEIATTGKLEAFPNFYSRIKVEIPYIKTGKTAIIDKKLSSK